jgi:hypothetical protein
MLLHSWFIAEYRRICVLEEKRRTDLALYWFLHASQLLKKMQVAKILQS